MWYNILSIVYITFFFTLSVILYLVHIPNKEELKDYVKSRRIMSHALFGVAILGSIRKIVYPHLSNPYTDIFLLQGICYLFTFFNYLSFLYMIETSSSRRKHVARFSLMAFPLVMISATSGFFFPDHIKTATIVTSCIFVLIHFILLNWCLREYDKFMLLINNYFGNYRNIRWVPFCLWFTFAVACLSILAIYLRELIPLAAFSSLFIYTFISMKLLNFVPQYIHEARESVKKNEVVSHSTQDDSISETIDTAETVISEVTDAAVSESAPVSETTPAQDTEKDINATRLEKRYEKVAALIKKWTEAEKYVTPGINIKDVATEMGTNSNYLSTYINNVLGTTFALWLNTLRIEKSKEYLSANGRISMEECGMKVGYESLYNYSRWFKTVTGMSPSHWRRHNCE